MPPPTDRVRWPIDDQRKFVFFPMEMYGGNIGGKSAFETIFFFTQINFEKNDLRVVGILWGSKLLALLLLLLLLPFLLLFCYTFCAKCITKSLS